MANARQFYATRDQLPPLGVIVLVIWGGRGPFEAARVAHPQTKRACWMTRANGEAVFLPVTAGSPDPQRPWAGWHRLQGDAPELWAPRVPEAWQLKLPDPALLYAPPDGMTLWNARQSFDAVNVALEMEAEREAARSGSARGGRLDEGESPRANKRSLWWLIPHEVRYAPAGQISKREAEGRIMRALASESFTDGFAAGLERNRALLYLMDDADVRALAEHENKYPQGSIALFEELGPDRQDYPIAMGWFAALAHEDLEGARLARVNGMGGYVRPQEATAYPRRAALLILASRPYGLSFSQIGKMLGLNRKRVPDAYRDAITAIWEIGNGFKADGLAVQAAALDAVRAGNRRHKTRRTGGSDTP